MYYFIKRAVKNHKVEENCKTRKTGKGHKAKKNK